MEGASPRPVEHSTRYEVLVQLASAQLPLVVSFAISIMSTALSCLLMVGWSQ
jgi:hypothetical protein